MRFVATAFGGFWLALGILALAWSIGVGRNRGVWITLNNFLPAMFAVIAFGWLAFQLSNLQAEGSRESLPHSFVAEVAE